MTYDLSRLRLPGLIERIPPPNRYLPTADGIRVAVFYTKLPDRLLRPLVTANTPPAPRELQQALATINHTVKNYITNARLGSAA